MSSVTAENSGQSLRSGPAAPSPQSFVSDMQNFLVLSDMINIDSLGNLENLATAPVSPSANSHPSDARSSLPMRSPEQLRATLCQLLQDKEKQNKEIDQLNERMGHIIGYVNNVITRSATDSWTDSSFPGASSVGDGCDGSMAMEDGQRANWLPGSDSVGQIKRP
ncbi:hypothetical protein CGMCC3_g12959 [Colletotrichum fructicola]|uniref:Uncharacterized protein n=1 Tax=Colletotrichum fructicola (strain Nara gc5) TaxID=1213859 RepID=A0A7J6IGD5_COLFN|nr:uncharacterized protein CGMCC3_g12959 [Colletotrichum fructicola]KAE9571010.1 hypothetical protein CGMCC3_g12959 [Colletotrichum fructicola]KAF4418998.1 hypothetical protein CFRS1_v015682 [Colletotrichum fructicola]KAF4475051.1 hypothetical protein CGGC5_v015970 [Colletotrichum fructicola Nara gc5]